MYGPVNLREKTRLLIISVGLGLTPLGLQIPSTLGVAIWSPVGGGGQSQTNLLTMMVATAEGGQGKWNLLVYFPCREKTVHLPKIIRTVCPKDSLHPTWGIFETQENVVGCCYNLSAFVTNFEVGISQ